MSKQSNEAKVQNKEAMIRESGYGYAVILNLEGKKQEGVHYDETYDETGVRPCT